MKAHLKIISLIPCFISIVLCLVLLIITIRINHIDISGEYYLEFVIVYFSAVILNVILFRGKMNVVLAETEGYLALKWIKKTFVFIYKKPKNLSYGNH